MQTLRTPGTSGSGAFAAPAGPGILDAGEVERRLRADTGRARACAADHLVTGLWAHVARWCYLTLGAPPPPSCDVRVVSLASLPGALGTFRPGRPAQIRIRCDALRDVSLLLVVLAHEYAHHLHAHIVGPQRWRACAAVLAEGFAEHAAQAFLDDSRYRLPPSLRRSWDPGYELGRRIVEQIVEREGFGLAGFVRAFLLGASEGDSWHALDRLF